MRKHRFVFSVLAVLAVACGNDVKTPQPPHAAGASGTSGAAGASGVAGSNEMAASAGEAGAPGVSGAAGADGTAGAAGEIGSPVLGCNDELKALDLGPDATVKLVKLFLPGDVLSLNGGAGEDDPVTPVELCLVKLTVGPGNPGPAAAPSTSSGIGVEIWLPTRENWNGRYEALGNGGFAGGAEIKSLTAIGALRPGPSALFDAGQGMVTSINDGGHLGIDGSFAMQPDGSFNAASWSDFAERASHEMVLKTKALIKAFYGREPTYSYFVGCSEGGREALMEAQRYPEDFDGVLAGAPAAYFDRLNISHLWPQVVMRVELGGPMPAAKLAAVTAAANAACGSALTGEPDGYISDPTTCRYDPTGDTALLCASAGGTNTAASCLTLAEATAVNKIWYGPTTSGTIPTPASDNGRDPLGALAQGQLWFGLSRGTLLAGHFIWDGLAGQLPSPIGTDTVALALGDAAFAQPSFMNASGNGQNEWQSIDYAGSTSFASVFAASHANLGPSIETADPDLSAFAERGGRLLLWHGTSDSLIPSQGTVRYYEAVAQSAGGYTEAQSFARLYLAPGFDHCFGAGVPGTHPPAPGGQGDPGSGLLDVLKTWVEDELAPDQLSATSEPGVTPAQTRPWCLYPKKLKYVTGADTGTFTCE